VIVVESPIHEAVELDRDDRFWLLVYRQDLVELRIRIEHCGVCDPDTFFFEVRLTGTCDFIPLGTALCAPIEFSPTWPDPVDASEFPLHWRAEFLMLAQVWSDISDRVWPAPALGYSRIEGIH
jgi:hypothetical protein